MSRRGLNPNAYQWAEQRADLRRPAGSGEFPLLDGLPDPSLLHEIVQVVTDVLLLESLGLESLLKLSDCLRSPTPCSDSPKRVHDLRGKYPALPALVTHGAPSRILPRASHHGAGSNEEVGHATPGPRPRVAGALSSELASGDEASRPRRT
jgi:hypothetical protein